MSLQVSYKKQSILGILILLIILLAVEGLLRIDDYYNNQCIFITSNIYPDLDYGTQKQMCNDYRDIAYLTGIDRQILPNQESKTVHINNFGMRGPDITQDKPNDIYRIFVIGGSTVYGSGSSSDATSIPGFLQERFDNSGINQKIQVINAGIEGSTSIEEVFRIKNNLVNFDPDMIVIYHGVNDAGVSWERYTNDSWKSDTPFDKKVLVFFQAYLPEYKTPVLALYLINKIGITAGGGANEPYFKSEHMVERSALWHDRIKVACEFGNEKGFKTIVFLQPVLGTGNKPLTEYEQNYSQTSELIVGAQGEHRLIEQKKRYDTFANGLVGLDNSCHTVKDLRNIFDNVPEFIYFDNAHMADYGNNIVTENIFEILKPIVLEGND